MFLSKVFIAAMAGITALAHPGPHAPISDSQLARRDQMAKRCGNHVASFNQRRMAKRGMAKRWEGSGHNTTFEITTEAPYYDKIQNDTCVLTPEVTEGPYVWPRSQTLRQDMTEGQPGVPLWLDVGVLDMATCEPLPNVLLDFWHCNATGSYSSFTGLSPNTPFADLLSEMNVTTEEMGSADLHTDNTTWLRGMWPTNENGLMEMKTIVPGFYVERAIHIHVQAHTDWSVRENGTLVAGNTVSTGQLYLEEQISQEIMSLEPYASHTQIERTTNDVDSVFEGDTKGGYNPVISVIPADGKDVRNGLIGYITIGIDTTEVEN